VRFRRLRLAGFKSFVDPVDMRIDDGLTGIVGPNGCGKSNLLEAIRWVMGESSPKSMRGGGMEDVIFAGTDRRPARDSASVTLHLENSDRRAPAQFNELDEIDVVRHIERGLGSAYRVNGRDVRQKDVQLLFADAATGAHSPALVSQGRIGAIISAKPQDRRLLLEEAAGIAGLHVRRKDAEQRLRAAEANLARLQDVLTGLEAQAGSLKRQARQAERYKKISAQIRTAEATLLFAKWTEAAADAAEARQLADDVRQKIDEATRLAATIATRQADAAADLQPLREAEAQAAAALQRLTLRRESLAAELADIERRQREAETRRDAASHDLEREAALSSDAAAAMARLAAEAAAIAARIDEDTKQLAPMEARIAQLEGEVGSDQAALDARLHEQADAQGRRRALEAEANAARSQISRAIAERDRARDGKRRAEAENNAMAAIAEAEIARGEATLTVDRAARDLVEAEAARDTAEAAREAAQTERGEQQARLSALIGERQSLERSLADGEVDADGTPLLDLVGVAPGYEAAFAAALGDDASAVVGSAGTRVWCGSDVAGPPLPAGVRALADVVEAPAALAARLAQVGIADDADLASLAPALAVGQRLVTVSGRLVRWDGYRAEAETSGTSAERLRQRARLAVVEAELPAAEAAVASAEARLAAAREALASAQSRIDLARAARRKAEDDVATLGARISKLAGEAERQAAQIEAFAQSIQRFEDIITEAEGALAAADAGLVALPHVESLANAVTAARNQADDHRSELATARAELTALRRALDSSADRRAAITAETEDWQRRISASQAQHAELVARQADANATLTALADAPAAVASKQAALAGELADAEKLRQAAADALAAAEALQRRLDGEARDAAELLSGFREERGRLEARLENQELRRAEISRIASERFQCSPQMLPEKLEFSDESLADAATLSNALERLTAERERMGPVNLRADVELAEIETTLTTSNAEREELETAIARLRGSIGSLNREGRARLLTAFEEVNRHFTELFTGLFAGGEARLELIESDDPLEAGLEIMAQPPGKKLQAMTLLSGGEQALTAIALIFALFLTNPAPICVLDEVDAPLDDANIERFCDLLDRMSMLTDTRFLIVTHNAVTMSRMHRLYGVTMGEKGVSQLVSVDLGGAETLLAAE
jgi:chromosome segregation protein